MVQCGVPLGRTLGLNIIRIENCGITIDRAFDRQIEGIEGWFRRRLGLDDDFPFAVRHYKDGWHRKREDRNKQYKS